MKTNLLLYVFLANAFNPILTNKTEDKLSNEIKINLNNNVVHKKSIVRKNVPLDYITLTCYQPIKEQCNSQPLITADGSKINLDKLKNGQIKWCAISRDLEKYFPMGKHKQVYIEGYGLYEVRDRMNKRWKKRIDILIHPNDKTRFKLNNVKIFLP